MERIKKILTGSMMYAVMLFVVIISLFPVLWVINASFKTNAEILSNPFSLPGSLSFEAYQYLFANYSFGRYFANSLLAAGVSTIVSLMFYAMGAYVLAKFNFPGKNLFFVLFTITLLVPAHSRTQPIFSLIMHLNLYDNIWGVTLVYLSCLLYTSDAADE